MSVLPERPLAERIAFAKANHLRVGMTVTEVEDLLARVARLAVAEQALRQPGDECLLPVEAGGSCADLYPVAVSSWCVPCFAAAALVRLDSAEEPSA